MAIFSIENLPCFNAPQSPAFLIYDESLRASCNYRLIAANAVGARFVVVVVVDSACYRWCFSAFALLIPLLYVSEHRSSFYLFIPSFLFFIAGAPDSIQALEFLIFFRYIAICVPHIPNIDLMVPDVFYVFSNFVSSGTFIEKFPSKNLLKSKRYGDVCIRRGMPNILMAGPKCVSVCVFFMLNYGLGTKRKSPVMRESSVFRRT